MKVFCSGARASGAWAFATALAASACLMSTQAQALTIDDIDLASFSFDVAAYDKGSLSTGLADDATASDSINFGLVPTDYRGVTLVGSRVVLNSAAGGLALFDNINSLTMAITRIRPATRA